MKQATLIAAISVAIQILISALYMVDIGLPFIEILSYLSVLSNIGLLYFFVKLYMKQNNGV